MANAVPNAQPTVALTQAVATRSDFPSRPDIGEDQSINPGSSRGEYLGQINLYATASDFYSTAAQGQVLSVEQESALFALYGTQFGGDGQTTFKLPNLVGQVAAGTGQGAGLRDIDTGETFGKSGYVLTRGQTAPATGGSSQPIDAHQPSLGINYYINIGGTFQSSGSDMGTNAMGLVVATGVNSAAPGQALCDGRLLSTADYPGLFALIGTTYGGNGTSTFGLPDLRGRDIVGAGTLNGTPYTIGEPVGSPSFTVQNGNLPAAGDQAIPDRQPGLVMNYLIATTGIFPQRGRPAGGLGAEPALGQIVMNAANVVPQGWLVCDGSELRIDENFALFSLIGTTYGGDGQTTFALPDLRGRTAVGAGSYQTDGGSTITVPNGTVAGTATEMLTSDELPPPLLLSISTTGAAANSDTTQTFSVTFTNPIINVDASHFSAATTGGVTAGAISVVADTTSNAFTFSGKTGYTRYNVTVNGVSGTGRLGLNFAPTTSSGSVIDASGNSPSSTPAGGNATFNHFALPPGLVAYAPGAVYSPVTATDAAVAVYVGSGAGYTVTTGTAGNGNQTVTIDNGTTSEVIDLGSATVALSLDFSSNTAAVSLTGGAGNDIIRGGSGGDTLNGAGGNDTLEGGLGTNSIDGGTGLNTVSYDHFDDGSGSGVVVDLRNGSARSINLGSLSDTLSNIQNVIGSAFDDTIYGNASRNVLEGGAGADFLFGVGTGDILSYFNAAAGVGVDLTNGANTGEAAGDVITNLDTVYGSTHADSIRGDGDANFLYGQGGADSLYGEGGDDKLFARGAPAAIHGGVGNDQLQLTGGGTFTFTDANFTGIEGVVINSGQTVSFAGVTTGTLLSSRSSTSGATIIGGSGADRIKAGAAGDTITGGAGADLLSAGAGADTFRYNTAGFGRDVLYGVDATNDHIDLRGVADDFGDLMLRESGSAAAGTLATTVTIVGTQTGDAIALRGVSAADIQGSANFFRFA